MSKAKIILVVLLLPIAAFAQGAPQTNVAITNIESDLLSKNQISLLSEILRNALMEVQELNILERNQMDIILKEQGFQQLGCTSDACAVEMGQLMGVQAIITSGLGQIGAMYVMTIKMLDVESGKIIHTSTIETRTKEREDLINLTRKLANGFARKIRKTIDVIIKSQPAGAQVKVNSVKKGKTPLLLELNQGSYALNLSLKHYKDVLDTVLVSADNSAFKYELEYHEDFIKAKSKSRKKRKFYSILITTALGAIGAGTSTAAYMASQDNYKKGNTQHNLYVAAQTGQEAEAHRAATQKYDNKGDFWNSVFIGSGAAAVTMLGLDLIFIIK